MENLNKINENPNEAPISTADITSNFQTYEQGLKALDTLNNGPTQKLITNFGPEKLNGSATIDKASIPEKVILNLPTEADNVEIRETQGNTITVETYVPINMNDVSRNAESNKTLKESFDVEGRLDTSSKTLTINGGKFDKLIAGRYDPNTPVKYIINLPKSMAVFNADGKPFQKNSSDKASENTLDTAANTSLGKKEAEQSNKTLSNRINMALSATVRDIPENFGAYIQLVDDIKGDRSLTDEGKKAALEALAKKYPKGEVEYKYREYKKENPNEGNK